MVNSATNVDSPQGLSLASTVAPGSRSTRQPCRWQPVGIDVQSFIHERNVAAAKEQVTRIGARGTSSSLVEQAGGHARLQHQLRAEIAAMGPLWLAAPARAKVAARAK